MVMKRTWAGSGTDSAAALAVYAPGRLAVLSWLFFPNSGIKEKWKKILISCEVSAFIFVRGDLCEPLSFFSKNDREIVLDLNDFHLNLMNSIQPMKIKERRNNLTPVFTIKTMNEVEASTWHV